jgi:F0F1-type ATP synthase membrane subunit a
MADMLETIANFLNTHTLMVVDSADVSVMLMLAVGLIIGIVYVKIKGETFF